MRWILLFSGFVLFFTPQARAMGEVTAEPLCFLVINSSEHSITGSIVTDLYTRPDGIQARHRSNFRLKGAGAVDKKEGYPLDRVEFCSYGPFYPGRKIEFVVRTLFPVFSCKTNVESGPITIKTTPRKDDPMGGYDYSATCYE